MVKGKLVSEISCDPGRKRLQDHKKSLLCTRACGWHIDVVEAACFDFAIPAEAVLKTKLCRRPIKARVAGCWYSSWWALKLAIKRPFALSSTKLARPSQILYGGASLIQPSSRMSARKYCWRYTNRGILLMRNAHLSLGCLRLRATS